ncbi:hypothetical protein HDV00_008494 [Rhizophlyctis rosea]|nr:hypothetical protein HDV00_008494 [Rhizophlyctis rosea]
MHNLGRHLAPWFRIFIPDLPGFGRSAKALDRNAKVSIHQLAKGLHDWMDAAGIRKAHLVANSLGCQIIAEFCLHWGDRVDRIVLQGPTMDKSRQPAWKTLAAFVANGQNEPTTMSFIMLADYFKAGPRRATMMFREALNYKLWDVLPDIKHPTLVLSSELDPIAPYKWCAEVASKLPSGVHYTLSDAPHTANYAATEKMSRIVLRYLLVRDDEQIRKAGSEVLSKVEDNSRIREELTSLVTETKRFQSGLLVLLGLSIFRYGIEPLHPTVLLLSELLLKSTPSAASSSSCAEVADFDSASAMLRATGRYLHYRDFPQLGVPTQMAFLMPLLNYLPDRIRNNVYALLGAGEATKDIVSTFNAEECTSTVVQHYPSHRKYPAIAIGSSNGALTHLYTAMGIPWLPQTLLVPVRRPPQAAIKHGEIDMTAEMEWGRGAGRELLHNNPALIKLTEAYRKFISDSLEVGGTIVVVRCALKWPCTKVGDRHFFQSGAVGGITPDQFLHGSEKVKEFIKEQRGPVTKAADAMGMEPRTDWRAPEPDCEVPEAEWGFAEGLAGEIEALAREKGFKISYLDLEHPEVASPVVADLYREWRGELGRPTDRLLLESFIVMEPWLAVRYNLTPYWLVFPVKPSLENFQKYLERCKAEGRSYSQALGMLFCSGVRSIGLADTEDWKKVLTEHLGHDGSCNEGKSRGKLLLGVDEKAFPGDFGFPALYHKELKKAVDAEGQYVMPPDLRFETVVSGVKKLGAGNGVRYQVGKA